jgi:hypothetical protein
MVLQFKHCKIDDCHRSAQVQSWACLSNVARSAERISNTNLINSTALPRHRIPELALSTALYLWQQRGKPMSCFLRSSSSSKPLLEFFACNDAFEDAGNNMDLVFLFRSTRLYRLERTWTYIGAQAGICCRARSQDHLTSLRAWSRQSFDWSN